MFDLHTSGTTHDFDYKSLEPWLVQPTLPETLANQDAARDGAGSSAASAERRATRPPSPKSPATRAKDLFGDPSLATADGDDELSLDVAARERK